MKSKMKCGKSPKNLMIWHGMTLCSTNIAMVTDAIRIEGEILKGNLYIFSKYCIDIIINLLSKVKHVLVSHSFQLSFCSSQ